MQQGLTHDIAARFAATALSHIEREYPHKLDHVLTCAADARAPSALHPIFYGSFDWHSCVHGYWLLARLLRRFPSAAFADSVAQLFDEQLTPAHVAGERGYAARPSARGFERPYGWGWLLKLAAELAGTPWASALAPLAEDIAQRFRDFLPLATYAVRTGTHGNTAFAFRLAADYEDASLQRLLQATAERWYAEDADCPAWGEPGGDDFLSPTLVEAECLRRLWPPERFRPWLDRFLPRLKDRRPATLFVPARPSDRGDGKIAHLDGLNLSRAWCFRALAAALPPGDGRGVAMRDAADAHFAAALPHVQGDYMGEHWLATFALLAFEAEAA